MSRQRAWVWLIAAASLFTGAASADDAPPAERWHVAAAPDHKLIHGWMTLRHHGQSVVVGEHVGGGTEDRGLREPLDLTLSWRREGGGLRLAIRQTWRDRSSEVNSTATIPERAAVRVQEQPKFSGLSETYQVLWRAEVLQDGEVTHTVVYVARLAPAEDDVTAFDAAEVERALEALESAQRDPA